MKKRLGLPDEVMLASFGTGGGSGGGGGAAGGADGDSGVAEPEAAKVKDVFDIKLTAVDAKSKIKIIKEVRAITGLGLKEVRKHCKGSSN